MFSKLSTRDRDGLAAGTIIAALITFLAANLWLGQWLTTARIDLTEDRRFSVSQATRQMLAGIDEPITLRVYISENIDRLGPVFAGHAKRVRDLLGEYARYAEGGLIVDYYQPQPYSPEEDLAVSDGLQPVPVDLAGTQVFFGLAGVNSTDDVEAIGLLSPERARFLEHDLTRLIADLANPEKPQVAVIGEVPLGGSQATSFQPTALLEQLRQVVDVSLLGGEVAGIDEDVSVLIVTQPGDLSDVTLYAIDQFALRGGRVMLFVDPLPEALQAPPQNPMMGGPPPTPDFAALQPLLQAWGVAIAADEVVIDRASAERVQWVDQGRPRVVDYVAWLGLTPERFDQDDAALGSLQKLVFQTPGHITRTAEATTSLAALVTTSAEATTLPAMRFAMQPDPLGMLNEYQPGGEPLTLAARVRGEITSAFPDGPPEGSSADPAAHLGEATQPFEAIIVADTDFLSDRAWLQQRALLGQRFSVPIANNGDFVINAAEMMAGAPGLSALRGRGLDNRPFSVIEEMRAEAEQAFRETEQELLARIQETEARITALQREEQETGLLLTAEQQQEIDAFRLEMLELRAELREVRFALNEDVERLEDRLRLVNIWAMPALVALIAIGLALWRRRRAARRLSLGR